MAEDKRKLERFHLQVSAQIESMEVTESDQPIDLMTVDISSGGAFFPTEQPLPPGTRVTVRLVLPLEKLQVMEQINKKVTVTLEGTVLRTEPKGMAVSFGRNFAFHHTSDDGLPEPVILAGTEELARDIPGGVQ